MVSFQSAKTIGNHCPLELHKKAVLSHATQIWSVRYLSVSVVCITLRKKWSQTEPKQLDPWSCFMVHNSVPSDALSKVELFPSTAIRRTKSQTDRRMDRHYQSETYHFPVP